MDGRAEQLHHRATVRLLLIAGGDLPDLTLEVEQCARERQGAAPLPRTGLGGQAADALGSVVVRLRDRGVGLVRARRTCALVLVVDLRGRPESALEAMRAYERRGPPQAVDVSHRFRDVDEAFARDLLHDQGHREERREVIGTDGIQTTWM